MSSHHGEEEKKKEPDRILIPGKPNLERCDNKVISARYTALTFVPVVSRRPMLYCQCAIRCPVPS